ncbi:MAG: MarR family winged helix-turn-helix transcriptional regulator [Vicinamibacterales bacterium]
MGSHTSRSDDAADVQHVLDGIRRIVQGLRAASREARRTGLTSAQLFVLRRVSEADGMSINELAARTFTHQSSVSVVASALAARRFIDRRLDPRDRRRRLLVLKPAGRRALASAPHAAQERLVDAVLTLSPSARRLTGAALSRMADAISVRRRPAMFFEERRKRA